MNEERHQAYLTLIQSLLTCPSEEEIPILQANLELLDDNFARSLREWATQTLGKLDADKAYNHANILYNLNIDFSSLQQGSRASNIEIAIACLDIGLTIFTREAYSEKWAMFQNSLGNKYSDRIKGERGENIDRAIAFYEAALQVRTRDVFPQQWAMTHNNLATAYRNKIKGERGENIERAIAFYEAALQVYTRDAFPQDWAMTHNNLANAYRNRIKGERGENIEKAIALYEAALQVRTRDAFPQQWAMTQNNLANAYYSRIKGERGENIESAIAFYEAALQVYTRDAFPQDWATTQNNLAAAYSDRIKGERGENIEMAIAFYEAALQVRTRAAFPQDWAMTQNNLAAAYSDRIKGERGENIERAIAFYEAALQVYTRDAFPQNWAMTQNNLAIAYRNRIKGERGENIEMAIAFYEAALQVRTRAAFPQDWADTQNNLAVAYSNRIKGERGENIEKAIALYEAALQVSTRPAFPQDWAMTQENIAYAYCEQGLIPEAIKCFELSLEIFKPDALPLSCLKAGRSLGNLGFAENLWETAIFGYEKAIQAVEQSREWITSDNRKREIIEENLDVYEKMMQSCINHQQYDKALQTIERSKSRYLVELFTNSEIYPKTAAETEKQQLQNLRRQIAASQQLLETETPSPPPLSPPLTKGGPGGVPEDSPSQRTTQTRSLSPEYFQQEKAKLETTLQQLTQLLEQIKQREPEFSLTQKVEPIDITKFQQTLDTETAIIEWYIGNNSNSDDSWGGSAFIITRDSIKPLTYTTTEIAELETWKNNYLDEYRNQKTNKTWQNTLSQKLEKLSEILRLNEIIAHIPPNCKQLILVPHRYLHLFPLHALQFTSETRFQEKTNFRGYLLDGFRAGVKYAPSLQLLELVKNRITTRNSPPQNQQQLFALQNPTEDLFNADMEVETIKTQFNPHQILLKKQATKTALNENRENLSNANYLHFSCHGVFNFDNPLLSSLVLADSLEPQTSPPPPESNHPAEKQRYVTLRSGRKAIPEKCLTLREIFADLQLPQCSLVTLSACETGLTTSTAMTDEYIGLPSGFLYAGSMNVVSSLWAVDDFATAILMIKFYQELPDANSVALALNAAQNWMRGVRIEDLRVWVGLLNLDEKSRQSVELWLVCSTEEQPFRDPKYWAAFCATGY
ncbi:CHAT domain-containing protein [Microcoleus vaginatus GB1-A2]|uniref:CHAT domain-containing protein n=1 Tax=Microcoleus vaginatus TaxID=119532 RepID=UPI001684CBA9|nr:CHAT domain-containing protein [Microcoleus sp. FACHB-61]